VAGEHRAQVTQLGLEYDPKPPFACGSPSCAAPELVDEYRELTQARIIRRRQQAEKAGKTS